MTKRVTRAVVTTLILLVLSGFVHPTFAQSTACPTPVIGNASSLLSRKCSNTLESTLSLENSSITPPTKQKKRPDGPIQPFQPLATSSSSLNPDIIFTLINQYRATLSLAAFQKDPQLCTLANSRIPELPAEAAQGNYHAGLYDRNLPYWVTENMKFGSDAPGTVNWWLHSPIHHAAIVSDNKYSCGACNGTICVEEFTSYVPKQRV